MRFRLGLRNGWPEPLERRACRASRAVLSPFPCCGCTATLGRLFRYVGRGTMPFPASVEAARRPGRADRVVSGKERVCGALDRQHSGRLIHFFVRRRITVETSDGAPRPTERTSLCVRLPSRPVPVPVSVMDMRGRVRHSRQVRPGGRCMGDPVRPRPGSCTLSGW